MQSDDEPESLLSGALLDPIVSRLLQDKGIRKTYSRVASASPSLALHLLNSSVFIGPLRMLDWLVKHRGDAITTPLRELYILNAEDPAEDAALLSALSSHPLLSGLYSIDSSQPLFDWCPFSLLSSFSSLTELDYSTSSIPLHLSSGDFSPTFCDELRDLDIRSCEGPLPLSDLEYLVPTLTSLDFSDPSFTTHFSILTNLESLGGSTIAYPHANFLVPTLSSLTALTLLFPDPPEETPGYESDGDFDIETVPSLSFSNFPASLVDIYIESSLVLSEPVMFRNLSSLSRLQFTDSLLIGDPTNFDFSYLSNLQDLHLNIAHSDSLF